MKKLFLLLLLNLGLQSYSQSNTEKRDPLYLQEFESELLLNGSSIRVSKYKSATINETSLKLITEKAVCNDAHGVVLTLLSGEKLTFADAKVSCVPSETKKNKLTGNIILTPELYKKLSQTEIVKFELGGVSVPVHYKEKGENLKGLFKMSEEL